MAQQTIVQLTDDLDGGDASETVQFGLDGVVYDIDLNGAHAAELREFLGRYVTAGRRRSFKPATGTKAPASATGLDPKLIREWANENGYGLSAFGRIPSDVTEKYKAATGA